MSEDVGDIDYLAIGNNELGDAELLGETCICNHCQGEHQVRNGSSRNLKGEIINTNAIQWVYCTVAKSNFVVGIHGKRIDFKNRGG